MSSEPDHSARSDPFLAGLLHCRAVPRLQQGSGACTRAGVLRLPRCANSSCSAGRQQPTPRKIEWQTHS